MRATKAHARTAGAADVARQAGNMCTVSSCTSLMLRCSTSRHGGDVCTGASDVLPVRSTARICRATKRASTAAAACGRDKSLRSATPRTVSGSTFSAPSRKAFRLTQHSEVPYYLLRSGHSRENLDEVL